MLAARAKKKNFFFFFFGGAIVVYLTREPGPDLVVRSPPRKAWQNISEGIMGRGILLWLLGVPIPIIILLALIWH